MPKLVYCRLAIAVMLVLLAAGVSAGEAPPSHSPQAPTVPLPDFLAFLSCQGQIAASGPIPSILPCHCGEDPCIGKSTGSKCFTQPEGREGKCRRLSACPNNPEQNSCYCYAP